MRLHRRSGMDAGGRGDVAAEAVVAGMGKGPYPADVARRAQVTEAAEPPGLESEAVAEAGTDGIQDIAETFRALVEVDGMFELRTDTGDFRHCVAGLLEDDRDIGTGLRQMQGVTGRPAPVGIGDESDRPPDGLPDLADRCDVGVDGASAHLELQARETLPALFQGKTGDFVGFAYADGIVGRNLLEDRATEKIADLSRRGPFP